MDVAEPRARLTVRFATILLAVAFALRLGMLAVAYDRDPGYLLQPDSHTYLRLARALLETGRLADATGGPAHTGRTPGYPLLIAAVYRFVGAAPLAVVALQVVLSTATVLAVYLLARRTWGERPGRFAGVLLALDAASIGASHRVLTETAFTALVVFAVLLAVRGADAQSPRAAPLLAGGLLLAGAALTRPIGAFLILPWMAWLLALARRRRWPLRSLLAAVAATLAPWALLVGGWQLRNAAETGRFEVSSGPDKFLLLSRGADIVAQRDRIPAAVARERLLAGVLKRHRHTGEPLAAIYGDEARALVRRHPFFFLASQVRWLPVLLLGTGAASFIQAFGWETSPLRAGGLVALCAAPLAVTYSLVAFGIVFPRRRARDDGGVRFLLLLLVGYFLLLSAGPQAYSRFRVPFMPWLVILAGASVPSANGDRGRAAGA